MNDRIKELAKQARKYAKDYVAECQHYGHYMEHNEIEIRFEQKFAELIIDACNEVVIKSDNNPKLILHEPYRSIVSNIEEYSYGEDDQ